jgi:NAD(P)-dependent dehydrogenase (short-subunit alcohol dehydrogenase family)
MHDFAGKTVLITGGAGGLGRAIAARFAQAGASIALLDIDSAALSAAADALAPHGQRVLEIQGDITDQDVIAHSFDEVLRAFGDLDVLVNNVVVAETGGVLDIERPTWDRALSTNLTSYLFCSQQAARHWLDRDRTGRIVNIGSIDAELPIPDWLGYCVSKAGVVALTRNLALALASHKITVNCLNVGLVATGLMQEAMQDPQWHAELLEWQPLGRMADPAEVADAVLYLSSQSAAFVTGSTLTIDGGRLLQFKL